MFRIAKVVRAAEDIKLYFKVVDYFTFGALFYKEKIGTEKQMISVAAKS